MSVICFFVTGRSFTSCLHKHTVSNTSILRQSESCGSCSMQNSHQARLTNDYCIHRSYISSCIVPIKPSYMLAPQERNCNLSTDPSQTSQKMGNHACMAPHNVKGTAHSWNGNACETKANKFLFATAVSSGIHK